MNILIRKILLTMGLVGLASTAAASGADLDNGEKVAKAECAACHGSDGNSSTPLFPKIAGLGERYLLKQLQDIKSGTRVINEMSGLLDAKSDAELADMAAYFAAQPMQLSGAKEIQIQVNSGEKVDGLKLGARVYRSGNIETGVPACSGCHSPRGLGNSPAGFPRLGGQYAGYIEKQLLAFRNGDRTNDGETQVMRSVASKMSDAEIKAVSNFISGLN